MNRTNARRAVALFSIRMRGEHEKSLSSVERAALQKKGGLRDEGKGEREWETFSFSSCFLAGK